MQEQWQRDLKYLLRRQNTSIWLLQLSNLAKKLCTVLILERLWLEQRVVMLRWQQPLVMVVLARSRRALPKPWAMLCHPRQWGLCLVTSSRTRPSLDFRDLQIISKPHLLRLEWQSWLLKSHLRVEFSKVMLAVILGRSIPSELQQMGRPNSNLCGLLDLEAGHPNKL